MRKLGRKPESQLLALISCFLNLHIFLATLSKPKQVAANICNLSAGWSLSQANSSEMNHLHKAPQLWIRAIATLRRVVIHELSEGRQVDANGFLTRQILASLR